MELSKTDTVRLIRLLIDAARIIDATCTSVRSFDKARQLRQMAKRIIRKNEK